MNVDAFAAELFAYRDATAAHEVLVKGGANSDACRERSVVVRVTHAQRTILQAELWDADSLSAACVSDTASHEDAAPCREIGLFGKCHVRD
jgi:hypothetical protein